MPIPNFNQIFDSIEEGLIDQNKPNVFGGGSRKPEGSLKNQPISSSGSGICNLLHWVKDNCNYHIFPYVEFRWDGAFIGWKVYDKDGVLVFERASRGFNGSFTESNPALAINEFGKRVVSKFAEYAKNNLKN